MTFVDAHVYVEIADPNVSDRKFDYISDRWLDELEVALDAELDELKKRVLARFPKDLFTIRTEV